MFGEKFNSDHFAKLNEGVEVWNGWRTSNPDVQPQLRAADLGRADLSGANLSGANLIETNLHSARLVEANLIRAVLSNTDLRNADLRSAALMQAIFSQADLTSADLGRADCRMAWFYETNLHKANFHKANLGEGRVGIGSTTLHRANLTEANFVEANLCKANLSEANLTGATLSGADLRRADLSGANLSGADLSGADLNGTVLVETNLHGANLTGARIYGISVWNVERDEHTKQNGLIITDHDEPSITVDDLEVAQFFYLLLNREKLRNIFNAVTRKGVLILGRFGGGGLDILQAIAEKLRELKYVPIIFDFDRPRDRTYTETVKTLAGMARFVIVDLSGPSVPQELTATVPHYKIPFVPILEAGHKGWAMMMDLFEHDHFIGPPPVSFSNTEELVALLPERVIAPAEARLRTRRALLDELFRNQG